MDGRPIGGFVDSVFLFLSVLCSCRQRVTLVDNTHFPLFSLTFSKILFALGSGDLCFPSIILPCIPFLHILFCSAWFYLRNALHFIPNFGVSNTGIPRIPGPGPQQHTPNTSLLKKYTGLVLGRKPI